MEQLTQGIAHVLFIQAFIYPMPVKLWALFVLLVNLSSVCFLCSKEAILVLSTFAMSLLIQGVLYSQQGFTRLLGITHLLFWPPMLLYLSRNVNRYLKKEKRGAFAFWLKILAVTNLLCLVVDLVDVARYILGERDPVYFWLFAK
jgi:hypothetical protein